MKTTGFLERKLLCLSRDTTLILSKQVSIATFAPSTHPVINVHDHNRKEASAKTQWAKPRIST
jgi:hypothetical protein